MLVYIKNIKNCPTSGYGFLKFFANCEQWVLIYRTYCSLGCKNNIIILIENENLLSPHLLYTIQVTNYTLLFSLILFILVTFLPFSPNYRSSIAHAQSLSFPMTFFPLHYIALSPNWRIKGCWFDFGFLLEFLVFSVEHASSSFLGL